MLGGGDDDEWSFGDFCFLLAFLAIFFLCPFLLLKDGEFLLFLSFDTILLVIA
jgi:hypothetical protein